MKKMVEYEQTPKKICCGFLIGVTLGFTSVFGYSLYKMAPVYQETTQNSTTTEKTTGLAGLLLSSTFLGMGGGLIGGGAGMGCGKGLDCLDEKKLNKD